MDDKRRWPPKEIVAAIPDQALRLCQIIRELLPTTAPDSIGKLPFRTNAEPAVYTELDKLTYLFYGRTLDDFNTDRLEERRLGCPFSMTC
jgi:hypothetical protein